MTKNNSYAMNNTLPYYILDSNNVKKLYKDYFIFCRQLSENYIENNLSFKNKKEKSLFLNILQQYFLFCFKHNVSEEEIKKTLKNVQTVSELKKLFKTVKNTFTEKKNEEKKLLLKGEIQKHLYNYQLPSLFQHRQRIYIKINKTPSLSLFIQKSIDFLNQYHLPNNNIEIIKKEKNVSFLAQNGKKKEKTIYQYFVSENNNQEIKIGKFFENLYQKLNRLIVCIDRLNDHQVAHLINLFKNEEKYTKIFQQNLNQLFIQAHSKPILLSPTLFSLIKYAISSSKYEIKEYLSFFCDELFKIKTKIHKMQINTLEPSQSSTPYNEGDLIILSVHPKDIVRMSEYTDWETCMSYHGEKTHDLPFQIGVGSIIAYLVNSKKPYKKLARILLKPYISEKDAKEQKKRLDLFYQGENKIKFKKMDYIIEVCDNSSYLKKEFHIFKQFLQRKSALNPQKIFSQMYFPDKQYGLQNSSFFSYVKEIANQHINPNNQYGAFFAMGNYYRENLSQDYFIADKKNKNHFIQLLNMRRYHFNVISDNEKKYVATKIIYAKDIPNLNLSGVYAECISMQANDLSLIDERGLYTKELNLFNCENNFSFPENLKVKERLSLNGENLNILPKNIQTKELIVNCPNLKIIPQEIDIQSLSIINTQIKKLPNLNLESLNAKGSKITDLRNVNVSSFLNLSSTPIQFLNNSMHLSSLILNHCEQLKKLPDDLSVRSLDISNTTLSNIPNIHYEWLLLNNNQSIKKLPNGISFNSLEARNTLLQELPDGIAAERINLSQSAIKSLPNNLNVDELNINQTDIATLPENIIVKNLSAKATNITIIPSNIKIKTIDLRGTPIQTIHYSKEINLITLSQLPKFIHPKLSPHIFVNFNEKDILNAKKRYVEEYFNPLKINEQKILGPYQFKTNLFELNYF